MFNRLKYDTCAAKTELRDNVSIFRHALDVDRFVHSSPCYHERGLVSGNTTATVGQQPTPDGVGRARGEMVALENDLRGQTRADTRCPGFDYLPKRGLVTSSTMFRPQQEDIRTDDKDVLGACQVIDYSNLRPAAYDGVRDGPSL